MIDRCRHLRISTALIFAVLLSPLACASGYDDTISDHHDESSEESVESVSSPLSATDSVATAVAQSCSTTSVKGLATQLVGEVQCLRPATFMRIDNTPGLSLGAAVFPYLQTTAAQNLVAAQKARGVTLSINSALRTLPQQYLLYRWYQTGRCGIGLAASPGTSNHEGAIAVDINDNAGWRSAMNGKGFRWLGSSDPVHYDFTGGGTVDLRGISVKAFQRLWNRNNPTDKIAEDGDYGPGTAARLAKSPSGGFIKGADCTQLVETGSDVPPGPSFSGVPVIPDATEADPEAPVPAAQTTGATITTVDEVPAEATANAGCTVTPATTPNSTATAFGLLGLLGLVLGAGRRSATRRG